MKKKIIIITAISISIGFVACQKKDDKKGETSNSPGSSGQGQLPNQRAAADKDKKSNLDSSPGAKSNGEGKITVESIPIAAFENKFSSDFSKILSDGAYNTLATQIASRGGEDLGLRYEDMIFARSVENIDVQEVQPFLYSYTIKIRKLNRITTFVFRGFVSPGAKTNPINFVRPDGISVETEKNSGGPALQVSCIDQNCKSQSLVFSNLSEGSLKNSLAVIYRNSELKIRVISSNALDGSISIMSDGNFRRIYSILTSMQKFDDGMVTIKKARLQRFEVIFGESSAVLELATSANEGLKISGPLFSAEFIANAKNAQRLVWQKSGDTQLLDASHQTSQLASQIVRSVKINATEGSEIHLNLRVVSANYEASQDQEILFSAEPK